MTNNEIKALIAQLSERNPRAGYAALQALQAESEQTNSVYPYMNELAELLTGDSAYLRIRALILIAANAKWDADNKINEVIDEYLCHITDAKPIAARQCIQQLPLIAEHKPELREDILAALTKADITGYADSMRPLVYRDIREAISKIKNL